MTFNTFEQQFVPFCETPGIKSGKAKSYYRAIKYLAEYLNMNAIGLISIPGHLNLALVGKAE